MKMTVPETKYLTYSEVAAILRCCPKTVFNRVKSGDIHPIYHGRKVLFPEGCWLKCLRQADSMTSDVPEDERPFDP